MTQHEDLTTSLAGKKAIVTGASRGIGRAIAADFARAGADVGVLARNEELLQETADLVRAEGRTSAVAVADILDADVFRGALAALAEELGGVDILVNNAGGNNFSMPLAQARYSGWSKVVRLNLDSVVHACQEIIPGLVQQGSGSVINMSSIVSLRGAPGMSHYGAAKAGVVNLTQSLALETAAAGVRINALLPGWIDTDLTDFLRASEQTESAVLSRVPMGRWGTSEEIAAAARFLASDASGFMTGQSLVIDGGLSAMP
ncbi:MAG: SDR family oxidoreductase [Actinomycetia bacterium]|nr:SDR family oxidoreductase [Actinomycetes bacterium]